MPDGTTLDSVHVEAKVKVPQPGQGLWSSLILSPLQEKYGGWPASGEVSGCSCWCCWRAGCRAARVRLLVQPAVLPLASQLAVCFCLPCLAAD